ncbi:torsin-1A-like [Diadema antillarum]|uniref:torsin-1A-like n=1 Tax=Diadema antillarum TaxID=105358 RepID=UPI003A83FB1A
MGLRVICTWFFTLLFLLTVGLARVDLQILLRMKEILNPWNPACRIQECCFNTRSYNPNMAQLERSLDRYLFGQHLAKMILLGAVRGHIQTANPEKPLVLSLHGPAGTGKNHITRLLVESIYPKGLESRFVTVKMATKDFPHKSLLAKYQAELVQLIREKMSSCPHHIFVFDEVDNMPPGLLDSLKPFMDYYDSVDGVDYRHAIFILRSNLAANAITKYTIDKYEEGRNRWSIQLPELEKVITNEVIQQAGTGLYLAKIVSSHLVSHFVPFLPLEKVHVRQCIQEEFRRRGREVSEEAEEEVLSLLQFTGSNDSQQFSVKGCKNVAEKVIVHMFSMFDRNQDTYRNEL